MPAPFSCELPENCCAVTAFTRSCFGLDVELEPQSESPSMSSADLGGSQGTLFFNICFILFKHSPPPPNLMIFHHLRTQTLARSLSVLSRRDFHGKLSKEGLFHSPFQPTGEAAGPAAFSIRDLGAALLLPPAPHSSEREIRAAGVSPCRRWRGRIPALLVFPADLLLVSLISPTSVALTSGNRGTSAVPQPAQECRGCSLEKWGLPAGAVRPASAVCAQRWSRENRCATGAYENIRLSWICYLQL